MHSCVQSIVLLVIRACGLLFFPGPGDYVPVIEDLTFSASVPRICRNVTTVEDTISENDEDFTLTLTTADGSVNLNLDKAAVTITNDDCKLKLHMLYNYRHENDSYYYIGYVLYVQVLKPWAFGGGSS